MVELVQPLQTGSAPILLVLALKKNQDQKINLGSHGFQRLQKHLTSCMEPFNVCSPSTSDIVLMWSSRNVSWIIKPPKFPSSWGMRRKWLDFKIEATVPLNFCAYCANKTVSVKRTEGGFGVKTGKSAKLTLLLTQLLILTTRGRTEPGLVKMWIVWRRSIYLLEGLESCFFAEFDHVWKNCLFNLL